MITRSQRSIILVLQLGTLVLIAWLWQHVTKLQATFLSQPTAIWHAFAKWLTTPSLLSYIPLTLAEAGLGLVVAMGLAIFFASVLAASKALADIFAPIVSVLNAVPKIALAPLFLLVFGLGYYSKVYFIAASVAFIPFYSLFAALTSIEPTYLANAKMLGATRWQLIREIYIPSVIAASAVSLRLAAAFSLVGAVFAEYIASQAGIGYEILTAETQSQPDYEVAAIFIIAIIAFIVDRITVLIQRRFTTWQAVSA